MIPYSRQKISRKDISEVKRVLKSDFLTQGPLVREFEKAVASYCGAAFGIATNNATSALHIACLSLGVGPGDRVWTSPNSFVASANCVLFCGAQVDFVDIDPKSYNISLDALRNKLIAAEVGGQLPKVLIPVHFAGQSCEMEEIYELSKKYGFKIVEDASHAIGATYRHEPIGSCRYSHITVFSFHAVKIITTGEGGMAVTNDPDLAMLMRLYASHGIIKDKHLIKKKVQEEIWNYQQIELGFNYRLTDIQAALGINQLKSIEKFIKRRRKIAGIYDSNLNRDFFTTPWQHPDSHSSYHLYPIRIKNAKGFSQKIIYNKLQKNNIGINVHYIPIYKQPYFQRMGFRDKDFPESERYFSETLSLPIYYGLSHKQQKFIIRLLNEG